MARPRFVIMVCVMLTFSACNLESNTPPSKAVLTATPDGPPTIRILAPSAADEFVAGEEILVSVEATDSIGVNRVQLFANNQIVKSVSSESLQGDLSMRAILNYVPQVTDKGRLNLRVVAYRGAEVSLPAEIEVVVRESAARLTAAPNPDSNLPYIPNDGLCRALVNVGLNLRQGPSTAFDIITVLSSGTLAPIIGRVGDNSWWKLSVDNRTGWVSSRFTTEYGDCSSISAAVIAGQ